MEWRRAGAEPASRGRAVKPWPERASADADRCTYVDALQRRCVFVKHGGNVHLVTSMQSNEEPQTTKTKKKGRR